MAKKAKAPTTAKRFPHRAKRKTVPVGTVVRFVKRLDELKYLDEFLSLKAFVTLSGRSYDVIKRFVQEKRDASILEAGHGVRARKRVIDPCDGFECF
jgi:hypothetical protein